MTLNKYLGEAQDLFSYTQTLRRDFHQHPEVGFQEVRTAGIVARELEAIGFTQIQTGVAKTGVVALLEGGKPGPVLLIRVDMDALPMQEDSKAEYASVNAGVMHACGHDGHTAIGLTVAKILYAHKADLAGTIKFVFQPAEEGLGGADLMVAEGVLENPRPDYSLSVHVWNEKEVNWFGINNGPCMAAAEELRITLTGKGGHGAAPHQTIDPIYAGAQIVTALQSIVARNVPPLETAVVTIGTFQGGTAMNIIPPKVEMTGTIRTFRKDVRAMVIQRLKDIVTGIAAALNCEAEVIVNSVTPAVINNADLAAKAQSVTRNLFPDAEIDPAAITMGSEDMAFMMDDIPGCYIFVGSADHAAGLDAAHHHPKFDFDEQALSKAVALVAATAAEILS